MFEPEVESRPWEEQLALDGESYRAQLAYLYERSPFYREKLAAAGFATAESAGGLDDIARLPLTEKSEVKATCTRENPIGAHLCAARAEIVRIYSTSGTTGTPSYIPLTQGDVDNWTTGSARSYAASGVKAGERIVSTYNAGPFVAGAALAAFERIGLSHIPVGTGNTERLILAIELLEPEAAVLTPSYAAYLVEWAASENRPARLQRRARARRRRAGGRRAGLSRKARGRLGREGDRGHGHRRHRRVALGRVRGAGRDASGRAGVRARRARRSRYGRARSLGDGATGELVLTHLQHRAAPLLRFRTRDHVQIWTSTCRCGRTSPRVRCIGRTDDMLIVRGVNVFPSAIREVVGGFAPRVSGNIMVRPEAEGVKQEPPLPSRSSSRGTRSPTPPLHRRSASGCEACSSCRRG